MEGDPHCSSMHWVLDRSQSPLEQVVAVDKLWWVWGEREKKKVNK